MSTLSRLADAKAPNVELKSVSFAQSLRPSGATVAASDPHPVLPLPELKSVLGASQERP